MLESAESFYSWQGYSLVPDSCKVGMIFLFCQFAICLALLTVQAIVVGGITCL